MDIGYEVTGARAAGLRFEEFPERVRQRLEQAITELTEQLYARVIGAEPDRTGALISATREIVREGENFISGVVGLPAGLPQNVYGKAQALEYGAHKPTGVKAHAMRLDHFWSRAVAPISVMVGAYTRTPNIAAHNFLRGPLEEMRPQIEAELQTALAEAAAEE